jgi:hypothetical protein
LIHTDATKTDEKTQKERERQRKGETPMAAEVADKFVKGMSNPQVMVRTSKSGSMTQEIFLDYCQHFVASLEEDHGPVILFLDGHASRWNTQALKYMFDNKVFLFFFASHTSIWAQPNDCGLNKRVHWAIEQACKQYRRAAKTTSLAYFNAVFCLGWRIFLKAESDDLLECFDNNSTRANARTGVFPLNPFCEAWMEAIECLGTGNEECGTTSYEIFPREVRMRTLNSDECKLLRTDLVLDEKNDLGDYYCAEIQASKILGKWWGDIENGVSEGNNATEYSKLYLPESFATTECEKLVMTLIKFEPVDVSKIPLPLPKTKEERADEISKTIVDLTPVARPIHISYRIESELEQSTNDTGPLDCSYNFCWLEGTAIRRKNGTWNLTLVNGDELSFTSKEMTESPKIYIQNAYTELDSTQRKRTLSKKKRIRAYEQQQKEKQYILLAKQKQKEGERDEFDNMKLGIANGEFDFSNFQLLLERMRAPFDCDIEGVNILVTPDDATVMFDTAALKAMKRVLMNTEGIGDNNGPPKKRRRNTAAAETGLGLGCNQAHYQTERRDRTQNDAAKATLLKQNLAEKDTIVEILTAFGPRKDKYDQAMNKRRQEAGRIGCIGPLPVGFWVVGESDVKLSLRPFLRMFLPKYGYKLLGKTRQETLSTIRNNPVELTESSVNAKVEGLRRRLREVEEAIADTQTVETNEEPPAMNN